LVGGVSGNAKMGVKNARNMLSRQPLQLEDTGFDAGKCFDELDAGLVRSVVPRCSTHVFQTNSTNTTTTAGGHAASAASAAAVAVTRHRSPTTAMNGKDLATESTHGLEMGENGTLKSVGSLPPMVLDGENAGIDENAVKQQTVDARSSSSNPSKDSTAAAGLAQPQDKSAASVEAKAIVKEALVPPPAGLAVVQGFILNCVLPHLERCSDLVGCACLTSRAFLVHELDVFISAKDVMFTDSFVFHPAFVPLAGATLTIAVVSRNSSSLLHRRQQPKRQAQRKALLWRPLNWGKWQLPRP